MKNFERQYADSLHNILKHGLITPNRTGVNTLSVQHQYFYVHNASIDFPLLKGKKVFPKMALKEMMWMLNGKTDIKWLQDRGVNYWNKWANNEGTIGKGYGWQMRNFGGKTNSFNSLDIFGVDQVFQLLKNLLENPNSRRHIITLWNPEQLNETTLPPCVLYYQFNVREKTEINHRMLDCHVISRSEDSFLGMPYDIIGTAWIMEIFCEFLNLKDMKFTWKSGDIHYTANDYHLYTNHIQQAQQYLKNVSKNKDRVIDELASIKIEKLLHGDLLQRSFDEVIKTWDYYKYENFKVIKQYEDVYEEIKAEVAV